MMDGPAVRVAVRIKPSDRRGTSRALTALQSEEEHVLIVNKGESTGEVFQYNFWRVLEDCQQQDVYEECAQSIVSDALEGYNGTILAYGQTGAGKTYTMFGDVGCPEVTPSSGIMPRAIRQVFSELACESMWTVRVTFVEIYNETFRDLLNPGQYSISIVEDERGEMGLRNVRPVEVMSPEGALHCVAIGSRNRRVAGHMMNDMSSRSHCVLTLHIERANLDGTRTSAKLNLVDLAGSERGKKTLVARQMALESNYINRSLSSLSLIVKEMNRMSVHVSYRNSKLTHLLKDSLGGNCRTVMLACIWPDKEHLSETISTCRFSDDIQQIKCSPTKNAASSMESIHGNLFKMDPIILKYIETMTERRVALEMAKFQKTLQSSSKPKSSHEQDSETDQRAADNLPPSQLKELKMLRLKVKRLELEKKELLSSAEYRDRERERDKQKRANGLVMQKYGDRAKKASGSFSRTLESDKRSKISETVWEEPPSFRETEEEDNQNIATTQISPSPRGCLGVRCGKGPPPPSNSCMGGGGKKKPTVSSTKKWLSSGMNAGVDVLKRVFKKKRKPMQEATDFVILNSLSHCQVAALLNSHRGFRHDSRPRMDSVSEESDADLSSVYLPSATLRSPTSTKLGKKRSLMVPRLDLGKLRK